MPTRLALCCSCFLSIAGCNASSGTPDSGEPMSMQDPPGGGAPQVSAGVSHACLLSHDGHVRCWGSNISGEATGDGRTSPLGAAVSVIPGLGNIVQISAGGAHTCALGKDGSVSCWGTNRTGQSSGDGVYNAATAPVAKIIGLPAIAQISSGYYHSCALARDGSVYCWGRNARSESTGDGQTTSHISLPVTSVAGLEHVAQISAGNGFTCALHEDGSVVCWGTAEEGEATGDGKSSHTPVAITPIPGLSDVKQIAAASVHACALLADATVWCWGLNYRTAAQLGVAQVEELSNVESLAQGSSAEHGCVLGEDSSVQCWGLNSMGQVSADGFSEEDSDAPPVFAPLTTIADLPPVHSIAVGGVDTCIVSTDESVRCWGDNVYGQASGTMTGASVGVSSIAGL